MNGDYGEAYRGLGMTDLELKDYNGAYRAWLKAVELDPKDEKSKYFLGRLFYEADLPNEAAAWLREALELSPNDYQAATYLGLCAEALGLDDTAGPLYRSAVAESKARRTSLTRGLISAWAIFSKSTAKKTRRSRLEKARKSAPKLMSWPPSERCWPRIIKRSAQKRFFAGDRSGPGIVPAALPARPAAQVRRPAGGIEIRNDKFQETKEQEDKNQKSLRCESDGLFFCYSQKSFVSADSQASASSHLAK